jgi:DNA-binding LacI/PurR family transcriptional regulator
MTEKQIAAIAKAAFVHPRTVYKWLADPGGRTESVRVRIEAAMKKLRIKR